MNPNVKIARCTQCKNVGMLVLVLEMRNQGHCKDVSSCLIFVLIFVCRKGEVLTIVVLIHAASLDERAKHHEATANDKYRPCLIVFNWTPAVMIFPILTSFAFVPVIQVNNQNDQVQIFDDSDPLEKYAF